MVPFERARPRRIATLGLVLSSVALVACEADFVDLRESDEQELVSADAGGGAPDAGPVDAGTVDAGDDQGGSGTEEVLTVGQWSGRSGYDASGQSQIVRLENGDLELRFSEDFVVDRVPGPVIVLTNGPSLGSRIDPVRGDVDVGVLRANRGAQTYTLPAGVDDRPYVWVFCLPFGLEVARAPLEAP